MAIPSVKDLILYSVQKITGSNWNANLNQFVNWLTDGTADVSFKTIQTSGSATIGGALSTSGNVSIGGNLTIAGASPIEQAGVSKMFCGEVAPDGWLIEDGSAISRITYANLFLVIGTTYGSGDGTTTFNIPNSKGKIPVGYDSTQTEFDTLGKTGGDKNMQAHTHTFSKALAGYYSGADAPLGGTYAIRTDGLAGVSATESSGTGNSQNLQPFIVKNYIIKY